MSIEKVNNAVDIVFGGEHSWDNFLYYLKQHPVVLPKWTGVAHLVEEHEGWDGDAWFVFEVKDRGNSTHYKRTTTCDSFGGTYDGETTEVTPTTIQVTSWEPK